MGDMVRDERLYNYEQFFDLPIAEFYEMGGIPRTSRDQPVGFFDSEGISWVAIPIAGEMKRKRL